MRKKRSLIIAPHDMAGQRIVETVRRALQDQGIEVIRFDNIAPGASWANAFTDAMRYSDFLVADISRQNPNVFYELGLAHAFRKPSILIISSEESGKLPSDLEGFNYIVYDPSNMRGLADHVQRAVRPFIPKGEE